MTRSKSRALTTQLRAEVPANDVAAKKGRASRSGKIGEKKVALCHAAALARGVARLHFLPTPTAGFPPHLRYSKPSATDAFGVMLDGTGRFVCEEVKTCTSKKRFSLSEVEPHQRAWLDTALDAGGVAVLTVVWGKDLTVCVVPWAHARKHISLSQEQLCFWSVTPEDYLQNFADEPSAVRDSSGRVVGHSAPLGHQTAWVTLDAGGLRCEVSR